MSDSKPPEARGGTSRAGGRRTALIGAVVGVMLAALGAGAVGCSSDSGDGSSTSKPSSGSASASPTQQSPGTPPPGTPHALARYYAQRLAWHSCAGSDQCATLQVPLDYAHPNSKAITLAVIKAPATDQAHKEGSLVVNPGGPGGPTVKYVSEGWMQDGDLGRRYDVIGFDPRGVGNSATLKCADTKQLDEVFSADPSPDTAAERQQLDAETKGLGQGCLAKSGDIVKHMSTVEAAKDIDILRVALGETKLDYYGASYGTFLGATYANLFPKNVGRMVLDGALDPALSNEQLSLQQAHGFETALRAFVQNCVDQGSCVLGDSVAAGVQRVKQFLAQTEQHPLKTGSSRQLTVGLAEYGVWYPLYSKPAWPQLTDGLEKAFRGDGSGLLGLADQYLDRGPSGYNDNSMEANLAVNCLDHDDYISSGQVAKHFAEFDKASPTFGKSFAFGLSTCSTWPVKDHKHTVALHAKGAAPIVVVGTTRDPATPLAWAKALAHELDSGVLVTRDGDGHTGYNQGNACVDGAVNDYLLDGKVPQDGLAC